MSIAYLADLTDILTETEKHEIASIISKSVGFEINPKLIRMARNNVGIGKVQFKLFDSNTNIAEFYLAEMPGCCGIVISTAAFVVPGRRNVGLGQYLNNLRKKLAKELNYAVMICTDVDKNLPQQSILNKNGWEKILSFTNRKTLNEVSMHMVML